MLKLISYHFHIFICFASWARDQIRGGRQPSIQSSSHPCSLPALRPAVDVRDPGLALGCHKPSQFAGNPKPTVCRSKNIEVSNCGEILHVSTTSDLPHNVQNPGCQCGPFKWIISAWYFSFWFIVDVIGDICDTVCLHGTFSCNASRVLNSSCFGLPVTHSFLWAATGRHRLPTSKPQNPQTLFQFQTCPCKSMTNNASP